MTRLEYDMAGRGKTKRTQRIGGQQTSGTGSSQEARNDASTPESFSSLSATLPYLGATLLRVAWLAILLGLALAGLLVLLGTSFGDLL
jgi:hypothetical protein